MCLHVFFLYLRQYLFNVHPYGICKCKYCWLYFYFPCMFLHFVFVVFALAWYLYLLYALSGQSLFIFSTELCCHPSYTASQASSYWSSSSFWSSSFWSSSLSSSSSRSSSSSSVLVHEKSWKCSHYQCKLLCVTTNSVQCSRVSCTVKIAS